MTLTLNKPLQFFVFLLSVFMLLALMPQQADARRGNKKGGTRTSVNHSSNKNRNVNVNSNKSSNTNVNVNRNKNTNRNVNVDVDVDRRGRRRGGVWTGVAVGVSTAIVVGTIVSTLPTGCTTIIQNGISYQQCGTVRYQPQYSGNNVTYVVVK